MTVMQYGTSIAVSLNMGGKSPLNFTTDAVEPDRGNYVEHNQGSTTTETLSSSPLHFTITYVRLHRARQPKVALMELGASTYGGRDKIVVSHHENECQHHKCKHSAV